MELSTFECPRCGDATEAEFYGPCATCRRQLAATMRRDPDGGEHLARDYEPKMNVTPNAVALRDD